MPINEAIQDLLALKSEYDFYCSCRDYLYRDSNETFWSQASNNIPVVSFNL